MIKCKGYAHSVVGSREENQDAMLSIDPHSLYGVADGVGGGLRGEVASAMAISALKDARKGSDLRRLFLEAQASIVKESVEVHGEPIMGTTLTVGILEGNSLSLCHVGDSRCYSFRSGHLRLLSEDQDFFDDTLQSTVLSSYLGIPTARFELNIFEDKVSLQQGDSLLFCTDGLHRQLPEPAIGQMINELRNNPQKLVTEMCARAVVAADYSDNVSVVYVEIDHSSVV